MKIDFDKLTGYTFRDPNNRDWNTSEPVKVLRMIAQQRFAWPGGYEMVAIMTDGGLVCGECVRSEYEQIYRSTRNRDADGWQLATSGLIGADMDPGGSIICDHCSRDLNAETSLHESTFLSEGNGATLFCDTCGGQCRENEAHSCFRTLAEKDSAGRVQDAAPELLAALEEAERVIRHAAQESFGRVKKEFVGGWVYHADKIHKIIEKAASD